MRKTRAKTVRCGEVRKCYYPECGCNENIYQVEQQQYFEPFGDEWLKEMRRFTKEELIRFFRDTAIEKHTLSTRLARIEAFIINRCGSESDSVRKKFMLDFFNAATMNLDEFLATQTKPSSSESEKTETF